jgi:hypothetical protein
MKRDWIKKDEEFRGRGPKKYKSECWTKRVIRNFEKKNKKTEKEKYQVMEQLYSAIKIFRDYEY